MNVFISKKGVKMFNKRAVSPLIATVLLVMIVVSIGAAVMVVIQGLNEEQLDNIQTQEDLLSCSTSVDIKVWEVSDKSRTCLNVTSATEGNVTILIENVGQKDISGFRVLVFGDDGFNSTTWSSSTLAKNAISGFQFTFGGAGDSNSEISKIIISPQISAGETVACELPELVFDEDEIDSMEDCSGTSVTWDANI
jgi:flagellin-like protein